MMAFPSMLVGAAAKAGMKVPPDADDFDAAEFPHFAVFCNVQLCRPVRMGEHWDNAKVIAAIPDEKIMQVTLMEMIALGLEWRT